VFAETTVEPKNVDVFWTMVYVYGLQLLEEPGRVFKGSNSTAVSKTHQFYVACMNITDVEQRGSAPLLKVLDETSLLLP